MLTNIRLQCQQLTNPQFTTPKELVAWMGALQAQNYPMVKWAIGIRLKSGSLSIVEEALQKGDIIRTHVMRPTWHIVVAEDLRWMLKLCYQRIKAANESWCRQVGIQEKEYLKCNREIEKILEGKHLTREEMGIELARLGNIVDQTRLNHYLFRAESEGIICSGADKNKKPTYALLEERIPPVKDLSKEEALAKLATNYFRSHSPASLQDFTWWSGLLISEAKQAIEAIKPDLHVEKYGSLELYVHESCQNAPSSRAQLHLLPSYDEYLISYKERGTVMDPVHHPKAFNNWGIFYPVILYNGKVVGNWHKKASKNQIKIETTFFEDHPEISEELINHALEKHKAFFLMP
ncbi:MULTISPECIES: winged helix DNA-binding domain-containing protein [Butyricimonas]|uniref:winged helix DNA-binding domain-containing protein n=1 Tax=Butyricimonas TaxID=574697 RepID=UPI0007FB4C4E|nr:MULTISPECIES: winged helix DNA-binding domain-containing protein [Butyricimonas]